MRDLPTEGQRLYSEVPPDNSKAKAGRSLEEPHFGCLYKRPCPLCDSGTHSSRPEGEGWNVGRLVNQELHLAAQLFLHHKRSSTAYALPQTLLRAQNT